MAPLHDARTGAGGRDRRRTVRLFGGRKAIRARTTAGCASRSPARKYQQRQ